VPNARGEAAGLEERKRVSCRGRGFQQNQIALNDLSQFNGIALGERVIRRQQHVRGQRKQLSALRLAGNQHVVDEGDIDLARFEFAAELVLRRFENMQLHLRVALAELVQQGRQHDRGERRVAANRDGTNKLPRRAKQRGTQLRRIHEQGPRPPHHLGASGREGDALRPPANGERGAEHRFEFGERVRDR